MWRAAGTVLERTFRAAQHHRTKVLFAAALAALAGSAAATGLDETVLRVPVSDRGETVTIDVTVFKPEGHGPFPIAVLSHGSPRSARERRAMGRMRMATQAEPFVAMGFAVLVPTRRGYGDSGGEWSEGYGSCAHPDYYDAGLESAVDLRAAVDAVRHEPWADAHRVLLVGQSAGGFGSVAASSAPFEGLAGVVNFAGGRGSLAADRVCGEARLVEAMARYGSAARVPELWIYSANDRFFGPALARRMYRAFVGAGGHAEYVEAPSSGIDGHGYFARAVDDWAPRVAAFVRRIGIAH